MLSGKKSKQVVSANPCGNNWSKDDSKFGQKMLEKMGWEKGKGLGANLEGRAEHVKVSTKSDTRGVGFDNSASDEWLSHQEDFCDILKNLNDLHSNNKNEEILEKKSEREKKREPKMKADRARYIKVRKSKDVKSKSEADLTCIFGGNKKEKKKGIRTVESAENMKEYFERKMKERKLKLGLTT